jgi:hypothetical protein
MKKLQEAITLLEQKKISDFTIIIEEIIQEKIRRELENKKKKKFFVDDKNPSRIKHNKAVQILSGAGYKKIRSGEHQSIWAHETDKTKDKFSLPHHSRELSPGVTRQLFGLVSEEQLMKILEQSEED